MATTIIITVISIYGGIFSLILICLIYSVYNLKKIKKLEEEKDKNLREILKNSKKVNGENS